MIKKTIIQQLPGFLREGVAVLAIAGSFAGCAVSEQDTDKAVSAITFSASIGDSKEVIVSRATNDGKGIVGTYSSFAENTSFGVYADQGFDTSGMKNLPVTKKGSAWTTTNTINWQATATEGVTFKAYYPYKDAPASYSILTGSPKGGFVSDEYQLEDVLVATRTKVSYNNPALFLTFTHRFALLRIKLGNGFDGFSGKVKATMGAGIETTVAITDGSINLTAGSATTFVAPTTTGREYYVLVPADAGKDAARKVTSIALGDKVIENTLENPNNMPDLSAEPNTIYTLTAHVIDGSPVIRVVGIESWTDAEYLGTAKGKPGIYTEEELKEFGDAYNNMDEAALTSFGEKKADGQWIIYLQDDLYLPELDDLRTEENESQYNATIVNSFSGIFEGQGYTINGMSIVGGNGLFGTLKDGAQVNDLILTDASVTDKKETVTKADTPTGTGILAGVSEAGSTIKNCHVFGSSAVTGTTHTGGLVGVAKGVINRSSSFATVIGAEVGESFTGGLVGEVDAGSRLANSFAKGWVKGAVDKVGALVGNSTTGITIVNCYATVNVNGKDQSLDYTKTIPSTKSR